MKTRTRVRRAIPVIIKRRSEGTQIAVIARSLSVTPQTIQRVLNRQAEVDAAHAALVLDAMFQYGLVQWENGETESGIDVDRCQQILDWGKSDGFIPSDELQETNQRKTA